MGPLNEHVLLGKSFKLEVKNSLGEEFKNVNLFWCSWNGCASGGFSSPEESRWPLIQVTFNPSLCVWMKWLHTLKSMWLIESASVLFIRRVQINKSVRAWVCLHVCACVYTYLHLCECGQTSCRGPLAEPKASLYLGGWLFSLSLPLKSWERCLLVGSGRPQEYVASVSDRRLSDNHMWENTNGWRHQRWLAC